MPQKLSKIMTTNIATVTPQQSVAEAAQIMSQYNIGSLPVVQNGQPVGMITDRDITLRITAQGQDAQNSKVEEVMTKNVITGTPDMDVHQAANLMAQNQIRRLPVVENNRLAGIVALGDLAVQDIYQNEAGEALSNISQPAEPQRIPDNLS